MKTSLLFLAASFAALPALAADDQIVDLGDGTTVRISNGRVSVSSASPNGGSSSSKVSSTTVNGETVATVTTEVDGQRSTRTITIGPDGKAVVSGAASGGSPKTPDLSALGTGIWLGVRTSPVAEVLRAQLDLPEGEGLLVDFVAEGGPAAKAGLQVNDLLLSLNGAGLQNVEQFRELLGAQKPGQEVSLGLLRKGKTSTVKAKVETRPATPSADSKVADEAARLLRSGKGGSSSHSSSSTSISVGGNAKSGQGKSGHSIIITKDGQTKVIEGTGNDDPFESVLKDPSVPEEMKAQIRKARADMKKARSDAEKARNEALKAEPSPEPKTESTPE